jgi:hypothetical protein
VNFDKPNKHDSLECADASYQQCAVQCATTA